MLIRLRGCAGWSAPLLFAYGKNKFSHDVAHIIYDNIKNLKVLLQYLFIHYNIIWAASSKLSPMRAAKVQASLRIRSVSPEPPLLAHTNSESRGTFRQKARSLAPLNGWACTVKICHDGMLEDTNSLDAAHICGTEFYSLLNSTCLIVWL